MIDWDVLDNDATLADRDGLHGFKWDFDRCDYNHDGLLLYHEFIELLCDLDASMKLDDDRQSFKQITSNLNGAIAFPEFAFWWMRRRRLHRNIRLCGFQA